MRKHYKGVSFVWAAALLVAISLQQFPAAANHRLGGQNYPRNGWWQFATTHNPVFYVLSNECKSGEQTAFSQFKNSTAGKSPWNSRWPGGLQFRLADISKQYSSTTCTNTVQTNWVDFFIEYLPYGDSKSCDGAGACYYCHHNNNGCDSGGRAHEWVASKEFCQAFNANYPCGYQGAMAEINKKRVANRPATWIPRELLHEMGHGLGMDHHCNGELSIMMDAQRLSNGRYCGKDEWYQITGLQTTDLNGFYNTYPGWLYD